MAQSRIGLTLEGEDLTRLGWLLNSAASILYEDNPYWERWLVLEPRTVERGYIAYDEDSYNVFQSGVPSLMVVTIEEPPYVMLSCANCSGNQRYEGFAIDLLNSISKVKSSRLFGCF